MEKSEREISKFNKITPIIKVTSFIMIFVILFLSVSRALTVSSTDYQYRRMNGIYDEEANSLDAVYIGSSNAYAYWNSMIAWEKYGIAVYQYGVSSQPLVVAEYMIKEARKTQPDALYIININTLGENGVTDEAMHYLLDNMPFSKEKLEFTSFMAEINNLSFSDSLEYYFPLLRYHSRWNELSTGNFASWNNNIKNASDYYEYLAGVENLSENYYKTSQKQEVSALLTAQLDSLLDYCDKENVRVLFVTVPQARGDNMNSVKKYNTVNEIVTSRGYPVLDLLNSIEKTNMDLVNDFYNSQHANIHGSIKFTYCVSEYLIENYAFEDKRENSSYKSWNDAWEIYRQKTDGYIFDFELESDSRNYSLASVDNLYAKSLTQGTSISWSASDGADGYIVYRRLEGKWSYIGQTESCDYTDMSAADDDNLAYTVVPYTENNEKRFYGNFSYAGVPVMS